jgi:hypothetical protein
MEPITMTVDEALAIQAKQLKHYAANYPHVVELVRAATDLSKLSRQEEYPVSYLNRFIPRGGKIEDLLGINAE